MRILIADDHALLRTGIRSVLGREPGMHVVAEAGTPEEALDAVRSDPGLDVAVVDLGFPDGDGLALVRRMAAVRPDLPVLVLSGLPEEHFGVASIRAGAAGFFPKLDAPGGLAEAVRKVAAGGTWIGPLTAGELARSFHRGSSGAPHQRLAPREFEVFLRLAGGERVKEIAEALHLSPKTISTYRTRILDKMELESNADLVQYAARIGLLR